MVSFQQINLKSPAELRVYDSKGWVTGLLNREVRIEIPKSMYYNGTIMLFNTSDSFIYEVAGTEEGSYRLIVTFVKYGNITTFNAIGIPMSSRSVHRYTIDWDALSRKEKGVTLQIDANSDGTFERIIKTGSILYPEEIETKPWWQQYWYFMAIMGIGICVPIILRKRRKQKSHYRV